MGTLVFEFSLSNIELHDEKIGIIQQISCRGRIDSTTILKSLNLKTISYIQNSIQS